MTQAAVVIPVFQTSLRDFEWKSLNRCVKVLGRWPLYFVSPEGLDLSPITDTVGHKISIVRFPVEFFSGIEGYNRLMTLPAFYKAFGQYEYMLIYQLDAFVFEDRLEEWCKKKYDYVGAPALHADEYNTLQASESDLYTSALESNRLVFNGGLSLRRISAMQRLLKIYNLLYPSWKGNEDMLFSLSSTRLLPLSPIMKLPKWKEALTFAFEKSPAASYRITGGKLPFGCHAWQRYDPDFWTSFIH
jgi:hypothetical protein